MEKEEWNRMQDVSTNVLLHMVIQNHAALVSGRTG